MPGDPASGNDENLLNQIDELKARMDRLMSGGTSTSNSALLTDEIEQEAAAEEAADVPSEEPQRTRVRDLIGADDSEVVQAYPGRKEVVAFPATEDDGEDSPADSPETIELAAVESTDAEEADEAVEPGESEPMSAEQSSVPDEDGDDGKPVAAEVPDHEAGGQRSGLVGGSLISVDDDSPEPRPRVRSFDDLGNAIRDDLARDNSVPPPEHRKGPDLASRFGPAEDRVVLTADGAANAEGDDEGADEPAEAVASPAAGAAPAAPSSSRNRLGLVVAIWVMAAIASGAIATLHFTGAL